MHPLDIEALRYTFSLQMTIYSVSRSRCRRRESLQLSKLRNN